MREKIAIITKDNKLIQLRNIAQQDNEFKVDEEEFYKYIDNIKAIVHSHEGSCEPSVKDIVYMSLWPIPWIIGNGSCLKSYLFTALGILELDINTLISQELYYFLMEFLQ